jgi:hypothetical protein
MEKKLLITCFILIVIAFGNIHAQDSVKIMPFGDSITELDWEGGYRSFLYKLLSDSGFVFDYVGRRTLNHNDGSLGFSFPQPYWDHEGYTGRAIYPTWLDSVGAALKANPPDIMMIMLGTNDVANGTRSSIQIRNYMSALLDSVWKFDPNIKVVLSNLPRIVPGSLFTQKKLDSTIATNALWPGLVTEKKQAGRYIIMVDNFSALTDSADFTGDGIHPSVKGYKKMRYVWYPAVVSAILSISTMSFQVEPTTVTSGTPFTPTVAVRIENGKGSVVTGDDTTVVTLTIKSNPGNGILTGGGPVVVTDGIATFAGLSIDKAGVGYTLEATSPSIITSALSSSFNVVHGAASKLIFNTEPTNVASGDTINPAVTVRIEDSHQNIVLSDNTTAVTLTLDANPGGGTLTGGGAVTAANGIATFAGLSIDKAGSGYTLSASSNPILTTATSTAFNIGFGIAAKLAFDVEPTNSMSGDTISPAVKVHIEDANANIVTSDNTTTVTLSFAANPGGAILTGGGPIAAENGVVTFTNLSIDKAGSGYTLTAVSNSGLTTATSAPFNIAPSTGVTESASALPISFSLNQNYPNPFNPSTRIRFDLPRESFVTLYVYDLLGRKVSTLVEEIRSAGMHTVSFDASTLPTGVYVYTIQAGGIFNATKTMVLIK